jgi:MerR family mercuric resistance operon transcriptional regulator
MAPVVATGSSLLFPWKITLLRAQRLQIGELSTQSGVNIETIRYYERIGLMPPPPRTEGRQRVYDLIHLKRASFIRRSRELGFSLDQIRDLLGLSRGHGLTCAEVKALTQQHTADIRRKVKDLKRLERILNELAARCHGDEAPDCPILDALSATADRKNARVVARKGAQIQR